MSDDDSPTVEYFQHCCPPGVKRVLASGTSAFIGEVDDSTVLKYPLAPNRETVRLEIEGKLLTQIGPHKRIIGLRRISKTGLYLERAPNKTVAQQLESDASIPLQQRLAWCREAAVAVAFLHSRNVLHCDIQPTNLLLDQHLHVKLADFQGKHLSDTGAVLLDGWSSEPTRFHCPRDDLDVANVKTDLFALACTIYFIVTGHAVFPDVVAGEHEWHEKVQGRFQSAQFPQDQHVCAAITLKGWQLQYESAQEVVRDPESVEHAQGFCPGGED